MLKYITTYIPCYIWNENKFYEWMQKTIDSLKQYPYFNKMKLFICQNDKEESLRRINWITDYTDNKNLQDLLNDVSKIINKN